MTSPFSSAANPFGATDAVSERSYLRQVFAWMTLALALTTGVAVYMNATTDILAYFTDNMGVYWGLFAAELAFVFALSFFIERIPAAVASTLFCVYAGLNGVTFSVLLAYYTPGSVVGAFAGATGVFAGMAVYGYTTNRDLSGLGGILFGALIGFLVASVAYVFIGGSTFNLVLGYAGVLLFSVLTAYDMQKIKEMGRGGFQSAATAQKLAVFGALSLYLDFVNLLVSLLRIFGNARS